jgi:anaerobic magnesium-protoporphyrin IX monomethyl ester cyclase
MRSAGEVRYLLVNPPLTDPTEPYHSLPYLVGAAKSRGFTGFRCLDANVAGLNHLAHPKAASGLLQLAAETVARIESDGCASRGDEIRYRAALAAEGLGPDFAAAAVEVFRDPELFYHYPTYRQAAMAMKRWQLLLGLDGLPFSYAGFEVRSGGLANLAAYRDLCDKAFIRTLTRPFDAYIEGPFATVLHEQQWELIGFSVNYVSQLPFGLRLAAEARAAQPTALIVFGGTEVCDDVRFAREDGAYWNLFADADILVPGEGETPFCQILDKLRCGEEVTGIRGALTRGERRDASSVSYENVAALPPPAYDVWDWGAYWSPEPVILYSPTRGCYWNKCTFCDYGLNTDRPTSPARDRPVDSVLDDLAQVAKISRTVYFAVDAMSPRYLRMLCEAMAKIPDPPRWSAELRLERTFPKNGTAELMARAGCMAVSFGYESGTQRILDLIDKGTRIAEVPAILAELAGHGIGVQMMGFTGFPSETAQEAEATYRFLVENQHLWALADIGGFGLTPGSIVARRPDRFGIELLPLPAGDDIARFLPWRHVSLAKDHLAAGTAVPASLIDAVRRTADSGPFVGGTDSAHTLLYFGRFGRCLLPDDQDEEPRRGLLRPICRDIPFATIDAFTTRRDVRVRFAELQQSGGANHVTMAEWLDHAGAARRGSSTAVIRASGSAALMAPGRTR